MAANLLLQYLPTWNPPNLTHHTLERRLGFEAIHHAPRADAMDEAKVDGVWPFIWFRVLLAPSMPVKKTVLTERVWVIGFRSYNAAQLLYVPHGSPNRVIWCLVLCLRVWLIPSDQVFRDLGSQATDGFGTVSFLLPLSVGYYGLGK
jgi:hypothetical protein